MKKVDIAHCYFQVMLIVYMSMMFCIQKTFFFKISMAVQAAF
jgi:hypothetical protein